MGNYLIRRVAAATVTLFGITILVFLMVRALPGDAALILAGPSASLEDIENLRARFRLDDNLVVQYGAYLMGILRGDLGTSTTTSLPVVHEIGSRLPATLQLALAATVVASILGISLGVLAALRRNTVVDYSVSAIGIGASAMPTFWLGLILILVFAVQLRWLPPSGMDSWQSWILPTITLAAFSLALISRVTRSVMVQTLDFDYMRTARSKGLAEPRVVVRHGLRNALIPVVTVIGIQFSSLIGGAVLTEVVFAWPGIGQLLVNSVFARDYPVIQGIVLIYAIMIISLNLFLDLVYTVLDPRIRY